MTFRAASRLLVASLAFLLIVPVATAGKGKVYGKKLSGKDTIKISELLANADQYVDKTVRVKGLIVGVCAKRGCWMEIASDKEFESIRFKVKDGVIVFPMEVQGKHAVAEGIFRKYDLSLDETRAMTEHLCTKRGENYDPTSVTEPGVYYQIEGLGARIK